MTAGAVTVEDAQEIVHAKTHHYRLGWTRAIDRAIGKGVLHENTANRTKSRLAIAYNTVRAAKPS